MCPSVACIDTMIINYMNLVYIYIYTYIYKFIICAGILGSLLLRPAKTSIRHRWRQDVRGVSPMTGF